MESLKYFGSSDAFSFSIDFVHPSLRDNILVQDYITKKNEHFNKPEFSEKQNLEIDEYSVMLKTPKLKISDRYFFMELFDGSSLENLDKLKIEELIKSGEEEEIGEETDKIPIEKENFFLMIYVLLTSTIKNFQSKY